MTLWKSLQRYGASLVAQRLKASACNAGDLGSIPGSRRSPGEGNGNPLPYSCLENPMDGGAWWATVHGVTKSRTWLSHLTFTEIWTFWELEISVILVNSFENTNVPFQYLFLASPTSAPLYAGAHSLERGIVSVSIICQQGHGDERSVTILQVW